MKKIARIKFKPYDQMNIYDILIINALTDMCEVLYMYIDDRYNFLEQELDHTLKCLKKFNIEISQVIKYTDYYNVCWIYLHKLTMQKKVVFNYNYSKRVNDLQYFRSNKNNIKIFLDNDTSCITNLNTNESNFFMTNNNRYDNLLYDKGWIREIFLELIIDDSEKIDFLIDQTLYFLSDDNPLSVKSINLSTISNINKNISTRITKILKLSRPKYVLQEFMVNICEYQRYKKKLKISSSYEHLNGFIFDNLSLNNISNMGINTNKIKSIISENESVIDKNNKIEKLLLEHLICCDENIILDESVFIQNEKTFCIIDPVEVILDEPKYITILNYKIIFKEMIYVEKTMINKQNTLNIRLKYIGALKVYLENNVYHGKWLKSYKKKKIKYFPKWLPSHNFVDPCSSFNISRFYTKDQIFICTNVSDSKKILKIRTNYYLKESTHTLKKLF